MVFSDLRRAKTMSLDYYGSVFGPSHMHYYDQEFHLKQEAKLEGECDTPAHSAFSSHVLSIACPKSTDLSMPYS